MNRIGKFIKGRNKLNKIYKKCRYPFLNFRRKSLYLKAENSTAIPSLCTTDREEKIILSLTTYAPRFKSLPIVLKSLLLQNTLPDRIIVWCDCSIDALPNELLEFRKYGVEYRQAKEDLGPHKKYFYVLQLFRDDIVILVDDDLIYPSDLVDSLIKSYKKYPKCISSRRVHKMKISEDCSICDYSTWLGEYDFCYSPSHFLMATTGAGTLIPPAVFDDRVFDSKMIREKCLYSDDIWLKYMEILNDVKVVWVPNKMLMPPEIIDSQEISLKSKNVLKNRNDSYIKNMNEVYGCEISKTLQKHKDKDFKKIFMEGVEVVLGRPICNWGK